MEYGTAWVLSILVILVGMATKIAQEMYLPMKSESKWSFNLSLTNLAMMLCLVILMGITLFEIQGGPWNHELIVFVLFEVFLMISFIAFLVVIRIFRIYIDTMAEHFETE